jgi:G:T-mismatch repair DNA endonuclease (very short patch repair protein)
MKINILDFFDLEFTITKNEPKIKLKPKKELLKTKHLFQENGMPVSTSDKKFFEYHYEDKAEQICKEYKKFFNKQYSIDFYDKNVRKLNDSEKEIIKNYFDAKFAEMVEKMRIGTSKEEYRQLKRQQAMNSREIVSEKAKARWLIHRDFYISKAHSPEAKAKRLKKFKAWLIENAEAWAKRISSPEHRAKLSACQKAKWLAWPEETKTHLIATLLSNRKNKIHTVDGINMNFIEAKVATILNQLGYKWKFEDTVKMADKHFFPDFVLNDEKIIIECYGDFWHANPKMYDAEDFVFENVKASQVWERDKARIEILSKEYRIIHIWESDIKSDCFDANKLKEIING